MFTVDVGNVTHNELFNVVHVDEKWFYMTKLRRRFYMWHDEDQPPPRQLQSKSHITKVMFLVAVARPRHSWDGKVGCWPFLHETVALRKSVNRPAGTVIIKPTNVTKDVYRHYLIDKVIPSIKEKWIPFCADAPATILVQQDNARPHVDSNGPAVVRACESGGWDIRFFNQPPQSPDLNVLDLGFFNAIQALQQQMECKTIEELAAAVELAFAELAPATLDKTFGTLQRVFRACLAAEGGNTYDIPRLKNEAPEDDDMTIKMMNLRLEEEERLEDVFELVNGMATVEL
ncbi:Aste57867_12111 [Aphanomyces stellatus]|uniref:Aste57867_12111 protein n=1 Tax=Aphanomyces stellatus TaxID=120398 RepID=A0A485KUN9_9STRA|nr:hypothetical protein As57867_012066 [Aphanomyces stellatus]VFT88965.1 Aste57867_12111 [Aphanomyces stellatus]